jgi:hypothetical protein
MESIPESGLGEPQAGGHLSQGSRYRIHCWGCDATSQYFNIPSGVALEGALNAVGKYLDAHTERLHEAAVILVVDALSEAFPVFPRKGKKQHLALRGRVLPV